MQLGHCMEVCIPSSAPRNSPFSSQYILLSQLSTLPPLSPAMSIPFIPRSPKTVARNIATKMSLVREGLMARGEYLADPTIVEKVTWEPHGSGHRLVVRPPPSPSPDTREGTPLPDGSTGTATEQSDNPSPAPEGPLDIPAGDAPVDPELATLTMVVQLVPGQSWLYPDGRWTGPTTYVRKFTDIKLLLTGGAPTHPRFVDDYPTAIANLNAIMSHLGDPRNERKSIVSGPANHIRVRHQLFTVCPTAS